MSLSIGQSPSPPPVSTSDQGVAGAVLEKSAQAQQQKGQEAVALIQSVAASQPGRLSVYA
jgi:hypothetical protein